MTMATTEGTEETFLSSEYACLAAFRCPHRFSDGPTATVTRLSSLSDTGLV